MNIRNLYITTINKTVTGFNTRTDVDYHSYFLPIIRPLMVIKDKGNFLYEFIGKYEKINEAERLIYFKCSDNRLYAFKISNFEIDHQKAVIKVEFNQSKNGVIYVPLDKDQQKGKYHVLMESNRTLSSILSDYSKSSISLLNSQNENIMLIYTN